MDTIEKIEPEAVKVTPQEFATAYSELCEKMGYRIVVSPQFMGRDDGTFSVVLNYTIGQLPKAATT